MSRQREKLYYGRDVWETDSDIKRRMHEIDSKLYADEKQESRRGNLKSESRDWKERSISPVTGSPHRRAGDSLRSRSDSKERSVERRRSPVTGKTEKSKISSRGSVSPHRNIDRRSSGSGSKSYKSDRSISPSEKYVTGS